MMMHVLMHPGMVYEYPIWRVGLMLAACAVLATALLELAARHYLPAEFRRQHNDVAAAILAIIGVTYAVLLAFVAQLAWDGYNRAKASSFQEAIAIVDVQQAAAGFDASTRAILSAQLAAYAKSVIETEWPAQAQGRVMLGGETQIAALNAIATQLHPASAAETNSHAQLLQAITKLNDARSDRLLSAQNTIPGIVWFVVCAGGALTIIFCLFLGAPSARMQLAMGAALALSGVLVLVLIIALSNPFRGDFRVNTMPYERALARLTQ
jgi:hypothetical protein